MKKLSTILLLCVAIQGCTSIEQPVASRALVEYEMLPSLQPVSDKLGHSLNSSQINTVVQWGSQSVNLGEKFFSASGRTCRRVSLESDGERVYCQGTEGRWFEIEAVLSQYHSNQISDGK